MHIRDATNKFDTGTISVFQFLKSAAYRMTRLPFGSQLGANGEEMPDSELIRAEVLPASQRDDVGQKDEEHLLVLPTMQQGRG